MQELLCITDRKTCLLGKITMPLQKIFKNWSLVWTSEPGYAMSRNFLEMIVGRAIVSVETAHSAKCAIF